MKMSDLHGAWAIEMDTLRGQRKGTLSLNVDGDNASGSLVGEKMTVEFDDGRVRDNAVRWKSELSVPMLPGKWTLTFTARVDGDQMTGTIDGPKTRLASFQGSRAE
jgi:hypothetical protein